MFPQFIQIETTNSCPGKCKFCKAERANQFETINDNLFQNIIDECFGKGITYRLFLHNEPFTDPHLVQRIKNIKKDKSAKVELNTNGYLLTRDISKELLNTGIDIIRFSIDGFFKKTIKDVRGFDKELLYNNVEYFLQLNQLNASKINTEIRMIRDVALDDNEIRFYENHWSKLADKVLLTKLYQWAGTYDGEILNLTCPKPQKEMFIKVNGDVILCCWDWKMIGPKYSLNHDTIENIWGKLGYYREKLMDGKRDCNILCQKCNAYE
ncbi:MAG: radical SAM/SPASM domain-containing protein [Bacteroidetes bacterium]|jgi:wyosine [tRNA(Phe)-imidazoG37] synthetase (radical SAM superfamily)|nr:radical SAM/SPASM domain-containing protein [Bacteroidota bacterium]